MSAGIASGPSWAGLAARMLEGRDADPGSLRINIVGASRNVATIEPIIVAKDGALLMSFGVMEIEVGGSLTLAEIHRVFNVTINAN